jgi:hypothetical protein
MTVHTHVPPQPINPGPIRVLIDECSATIYVIDERLYVLVDGARESRPLWDGAMLRVYSLHRERLDLLRGQARPAKLTIENLDDPIQPS